MFILDDLLIGLPAKGLMAIFKEIARIADDELNDVDKIKEELLQVETLFEFDQISEEEYQEREAALLERLNRAREQNE